MLNRLLRRLVTVYRVTISPLLGDRCRFHPSCSEYARIALARHGTLRGSGLAIRRLLRCHPFSAGGHDPVPGHPPDTCHHISKNLKNEP